jgi:hypothetical protein
MNNRKEKDREDNNRKQVTIISLDYDKCGSVLFGDASKSRQSEAESNPELASRLTRTLSIFAACKNILMNLLDHITVDSDAVELYVGSARQDIEWDEYNANKNNNGFCFQNYAALCEEKNKEKDWTFRQFLLGDAQQNLEAGTVMNNRQLRSEMSIKSKAELIAAQLENIQKDYAGKEVDIDFYFIDDDSENIYHNELANIYFSKSPPASIKNFSLIKFDWTCFGSQKNKRHLGKLIFHTHIAYFPGPSVERVSDKENRWKEFISFPPMMLTESPAQTSVRKNNLSLLNPKKIVVISFDYDGCSSILFDEISKSSPCQKHADDINLTSKLATSKNVLMNLLNRITSDADSVEIYVGSNRQDIATDEEFARKDQSGLCFQNYAALCQKKNWTFREFLVGDAQIGLPAGTTMHNRNVLSYITGSKVDVITNQLKDIEKNYCDAHVDIDFHFIDDDPKNTIHQELEGIYSRQIPFAKIRNFSLIKFKWASYCLRGESSGILTFHTHISQAPDKTLKTIQSLENDWDAYTTIPTSSSTTTILSAINHSNTHNNSSLASETQMHHEAQTTLTEAETFEASCDAVLYKNDLISSKRMSG